MKKKLIVFALAIWMICFTNACKESNTTENPGLTIIADASYYPVGEGTSYKYSVERTDSNGVLSTGTRSTLLSGNAIIEDVPYQVQIDTVDMEGQISASLSYFRKTESGVFFFFDTTGLSISLSDTALQYLTLDSEIRLIYIPISDYSSWIAFKINFARAIINFNPVEVSVAYDGKDSLTVVNTDVEAVRLKFTLKYQVDPSTVPQSFFAKGWLAKDIGFVKWEGNGAIIGVLTGRGVDLADTSSVVVMNVTEYNIQR